MATGSAIHISRDRFHLAWDPAIPPIETVRNGAEVEFDLLDASGGAAACIVGAPILEGKG